MADRKWVAPRCTFQMDEAGRYVRTDKTIARPITGTSLGALLGCNPWMSPFGATCRMLGIVDEILDGKPAIEVGKALEFPIIKYIEQAHSDLVESIITGEGVFAERKGEHSTWKSDFDHPHFAGHVDCIITIDGEDYIGEVKTARDVAGWTDGVPEHYYWQVCLYNHFITKKDKAYFLLGIVDDDTYRDVTSWEPTPENCLLIPVTIDQQMVASVLDKAVQIYEDTVAKGLSTVWDDGDEELVQHLQNVLRESADISSLISQYKTLADEVEEYDCAIQDKRIALDTLKRQIADSMKMQSINAVDSSDGVWTAKLSRRKTVRWDEKQMKADNVDIAKYKAETVSEYVTFSRKNENKENTNKE